MCSIRHLVIVIAMLAAASSSWAQTDRGTFTGAVTDPSGSAVPNVAIKILNTQTNAVYETRTNDVGQYRMPNLPVGAYRITFEIQGFRSAVRDGLTLNVAQVARVDATEAHPRWGWRMNP
jgi:hypothetical protein